MNDRRKRQPVPVRVLALLTALCLLAGLCGCRKDTGGEDQGTGPSAKDEVIVLPPDEPMMGIGRITSADAKERDQLILIDPGHGFDDPGNGDGDGSFWRDLGVRERDVTIVVAKMLDEELRKKGFRTMLTHNGEYFPEEFNYDGNNKFHPDERVVYMNYVSPDYIVSVHVNSAGNANACGTIVFYNSTSSSKWNDWSEPAAEYIAEAIDACVEINASTKIENELTFDGASFAVTRDTHAAASLIEMGYVTNYDDAQDMLNEVWQRSMAEGIALGIARFFDSLET